VSIDWSKVVTAEDKVAKQAVADYETWKRDRQERVDAITVEVDGMVFDGDEISQNRMARSVTASASLDEMTYWTLHDNSVVQVTAQQLKTACRLAGEAQTAIWNDGRQQAD